MKKNQQTAKIKLMPNRMLYPIIFALGFIPLIVHSYLYDPGWQDLIWFPAGSSEQNDLFFKWKSIAIMITGAAMLILLVWHYCSTLSLRIERAFIPLAIYAVFVTLSAAFSPFKPQVFTGSYEVMQPLGTMLAYLVICYYTYCLADSEQKITAVLRYSAIGISILILIGTFQAFGLDFFRSSLGLHLILNPSDWKRLLDNVEFNFATDRVYATLYNPDFLSFYFGLLMPVTAAGLIAVRKKTIKVILFIACILSAICVVKADITSGYLAILISLVVAVYVQLSRKKKPFIIGLITAAVLMAAGLLVCFLTPIGPKIQKLFLGTANFEDTRILKTIETKDDGVYMDIDGQLLIISYIHNDQTQELEVQFRDKDNNPLETEIVETEDGSRGFQLKDSTYTVNPLVKPVYAQDILCIDVQLDDRDWYFTNEFNNTYYHYNYVGKYDKITLIPHANLLYDDAMTSRGYIWNLTIPNLPKYILIGCGANSYARVYPQNDYVHDAYDPWRKPGEIIFDVKAHNWFLQEWIENGLIGTLFLFGFYLWYFIRSVRIYRRCDLRHNRLAIIGFGIFIGTVGYVSAGFASDANVCTAPPFWVMMGLGMSINRLVSEKTT